MGFGLGSIGGLLGGVGSLVGAVGAGKNSQQALPASGYKTLEKDQKDFASGDLWDAILKYFGQSYQGIPTRRINAEDTDPIFGSKARQDIQAYMDMKNVMKNLPSSAAPADAAGAPNGFALLGRQITGQNAGMGGMYSTKANLPWEQFQNSATDADYEELAKRIQGATPIKSGPFAGAYLKDGQQVSIADIIDKYRRG